MVRDNPWIENEDEYSETFSCKLCFGTEIREKDCLMLLGGKGFKNVRRNFILFYLILDLFIIIFSV